MKNLTLLLVLLSFNIFGQRVEQFFLTNGQGIRVGQNIKVLRGSKGEGGFKFIKLNKRGLMSNLATLTLDKEEQKEFNEFPEELLGLNFEIKKIIAFGDKSKGFHYLGYFNSKLVSYQVDLQYAYDSKEIEFDANIEIIDVPKEGAIVKQKFNTLAQEINHPKIETKPLVDNVEPKPQEPIKVIEKQLPINTEVKSPIIKTETTFITTTFSPEVAKLVQLLTDQLTKELTIKISKELTEKLIKELKQ